MDGLQERLASLRRLSRLRIGGRGLCALVGVVVGGAVLAGLADWIFDLPGLIRALALVSILATAALIVHRILVVPLFARCDDLSLALRIEEQFPELNDSLASTVQFLEEPKEEGVVSARGSASLRQAASQRALALTEHIDFNKIFDRRGLRWITGGALVAILAAGHFIYHHASFAQTALWRLGDPFGNHTWTRIAMDDPPHRVAQGQPFVLRGQISGVVPGAARLEVEGTLKSEMPVAIKVHDNDPHTGGFVKPVDMTQQKGKFRFRIHAGDAIYPPLPGQWHEVDVWPPPKFAMLHGALSPQLELRSPAYTDLPSPQRLPPGTRYIAGIAGTHVTYRAAFDRPLESAWIEFRPENPAVRSAAFLAHLGQRRPLASAAALGMSQAVWGRVYARFETKQIITLQFVPWVSGTYVLHVRDALGLVKDFEADLRVEEDPLPIVQLQTPSSSMSVLPDAEIALKMSVSDERFAVRTVFLEFRRKGADNRWLDDASKRLDIYDHERMGKSLPRLLAGLAASSVIGPDLRLRPKDLEIATKWPLHNRFKEGEIVVVQIGADDFCDLFPDRPAGRSFEIELRIVNTAESARILDEGLGKAQQELVRLQRMEQEALQLTKDIQEKKAKSKLTNNDLDRLIEAEQLQKQIQERLGARGDEGMRQELAKLQQWIKDNNLPPSEAQDKIKTLKTELERLAREELQQIEPHLAEARKEMARNSQPAPKDKGPLDKAKKLQEQAKKTLDELARFLDPWASIHQVKGEALDVLNKQKELKKDVEKILDRKGALDKGDKNADATRKADEELVDSLERKADSQKELAERTQKLLDMIEKVQTKRAEQGDQDGARKLQEAEKIGKEAILPAEMRDIAREIKGKQPEDAVRRQHDNVIKNLEKMLAALEDRKEDDLDRLQKKQKNTGDIKDNLDKVAKDQDTLHRKAKEAKKIDNPEERARELKKLAEAQEKLKEEAQKNARELARLQEEQAARELNRAAQDMDRAAQKLADGQNPEDDQQEALDRLEDAQANLEDFEEELAREQLAKIADRIKGLKERQDSALERSRELHKKVMAKKQWSGGLVKTLGADILSQQGLAAETRALKEKIKEAKVFEHVFEKAAKAMDEAAAAMENRQQGGKDRQYVELEKDEIADENTKANDIERSQSLASKRLQRLVDSLKNDPADLAQNDDPKKAQGGEKGEEPAGSKMRAGDGIPPVAQLKVLRAEQLEINERTKEFAQQNVDLKKLNETQRRDLAGMEAEQARLHRLFEEIIAPADKKGDAP